MEPEKPSAWDRLQAKYRRRREARDRWVSVRGGGPDKAMDGPDDAAWRLVSDDAVVVMRAVYKTQLPSPFYTCTHSTYSRLLKNCALPEDRLRTALKDLLRSRMLFAPARRVYGVVGEMMHSMHTDGWGSWDDLWLAGAELQAAAELEKQASIKPQESDAG